MRWFSTVLMVASSVTLASCGNLGDFDRVKEEFHFSKSLNPGGHLTFRNENGSAEIAGWDRSTLEVSGSKYAPTREQLEEIKIVVDVDGTNASVRVEYPHAYSMGSRGAQFLIRVPRRTLIDHADTTNGGLSVEDLEGGGALSSVNGRVLLSRLTGDYSAHTTNGSVQLEECAGAMRTETTNGSIKGQLRSGSVRAETTNGSVDVTIVKPTDGQEMRLASTNGSVKLGLGEFANNAIQAETTHGSVTLRLPSDLNARLRAESSMSSVSSEVALASTDTQSKHQLEGRFGTGGPLISLKTSTGSVHVMRY